MKKEILREKYRGNDIVVYKVSSSLHDGYCAEYRYTSGNMENSTSGDTPLDAANKIKSKIDFALQMRENS